MISSADLVLSRKRRVISVILSMMVSFEPHELQKGEFFSGLFLEQYKHLILDGTKKLPKFFRSEGLR